MTTVKWFSPGNAIDPCAQIRQKVFVEEQQFTREFDEIDQRAWHVCLFVEGMPAATGRVFPESADPDCANPRKGVFKIGRIAVQKEFRGQDLGTRVMEELEEQAKAQGAEKIALDAQVRASEFYQKLGYRQTGAEHLDEYCPHIMMEKELNQ